MLKQEDSFIKQLFAAKKVTVDLKDPYYSKPLVWISYKIIMNPYFDSIIIFVIILNTLSLALDKYPQFPDIVLESISGLNFIFTIIFTAEAILKMVGLGLREFAKEKFNQFDLLIVIISIAEMQF